MIKRKLNKAIILTIIGIILIIALTITKINPTSKIASLSVFVGIAFFFIVEIVSHTKNENSGLRFNTILKDMKKPEVLFWMLLPIASVLATTFFGYILFNDEFSNHILSRTNSLLTFDNIPLLIFQVVIAAWGEEIAFRGFFVGKGSTIIPFWIITIISSFTFACGHIAPGVIMIVIFDVVTVFIDSIIYSIVYRKSDNLMISTISHIICNIVGLILTFIFFLN